MYPENLRYETEQGDMVRSKSEGIIANMYYIKSGKVYRWNHVKVTLVKYNNEVYHSIELNTPAEVLNRR